MTITLSRIKILIFSLIILIVLLMIVEYVASWEETLAAAGRPSLLAYQQIPRNFLTKQVLPNGQEVIRTAGFTNSYQTVPANKPEGEIRIGVLGASAVAGMGYSPIWSFAGILQQLCDAAGLNARVINLGRTGYSSRQLATVASKSLDMLNLDHLVLYTGNNEFLEINARLTKGENLAGYTAQAKGLLSKSALYRTLHRMIFAIRKAPIKTGLVAQKTLPLPPGVHNVVRDEFTKNLSDIAQMAKDRCRLTLCTVPSNLTFGPTGKEPFFLDPNGDKKWQALFVAQAFEQMGRKENAAVWYRIALAAAPTQEHRAVSMMALSADEKEKLAEELLLEKQGTRSNQIDPAELFTVAMACSITKDWSAFLPFEAQLLRKSAGTYEGTYYKGRIELLQNRQGTARSLLSSARNLDDRRIRIPSDFNDAIRHLAASKSIELLELETECWDYQHFNDYCHFNLDGNLLIAQKIFTHLFDKKLPDIKTPNEWLAGRDEDYLIPTKWFGVDKDIWKVYTQRPVSLDDIIEKPGDTIPASFWWANRMYFTWAGDNPDVLKEIEEGYKMGLGTKFDEEAKAALSYLKNAENLPK